MLLLHKADQDDGALFAVVGLKYSADAFEGPVLQINGLTGFDAALLRHGMQAVFNVQDDVIRNGGRFISEADNPQDSARGA